MVTANLCEVCWAREASARCIVCGRAVCAEDYDPDTGLCNLCRESLCKICGRRLAVSYCTVCGRLGCDSCLIQIDPSRWVCRECLARGLASRRMLRPSSTPFRVVWRWTGPATLK